VGYQARDENDDPFMLLIFILGSMVAATALACLGLAIWVALS